MEIRHCRSGRSPRRIKSRFLWSLHAVEIHSPRCGRIKPRHQGLHRYRQLRNPDFLRLIQNHSPSQSALQIMLPARSNIQVDPEPVGANFELFVSTHIHMVRLQKHLCDVAVPKLVPPPICLSIRKNRYIAVLRPKSQKQTLLRPQQSHFGLSFRVLIFPLPVRAESQWRSPLPGSSHRKAFRVARLCHSNRHGLSLIRKPTYFIHADSHASFSPSRLFAHLAWHSYRVPALCRASIGFGYYPIFFVTRDSDPRECGDDRARQRRICNIRETRA